MPVALAAVIAVVVAMIRLMGNSSSAHFSRVEAAGASASRTRRSRIRQNSDGHGDPTRNSCQFRYIGRICGPCKRAGIRQQWPDARCHTSRKIHVLFSLWRSGPPQFAKRVDHCAAAATAGDPRVAAAWPNWRRRRAGRVREARLAPRGADRGGGRSSGSRSTATTSSPRPSIIAACELFVRAIVNPLVILLAVLAIVSLLTDDSGAAIVMVVMVVLGVSPAVLAGSAGRHGRGRSSRP